MEGPGVMGWTYGLDQWCTYVRVPPVPGTGEWKEEAMLIQDSASRTP